MPFRTQYAEDTGLHANPFPENPTARIQGYFRTARSGGIDQDFAAGLWQQHLEPVYEARDALPLDQAGYDHFVVTTALEIEATLEQAHHGSFGIAQKIVNLFMKDLWALHLLPVNRAHLLHAPVDRGILERMRPWPPTWSAWTHVHAGAYDTPQVIDYLRIQQTLRVKLAHPAHPAAHRPFFATVIELDQHLWHKDLMPDAP